MVSCPDCCNKNIHQVGKLPGWSEFSGNRLTNSTIGGDLFLCHNCHLKFRFPIFNQAEYLKLYDSEISNWIFDENRNDWKILNGLITHYISEGGNVLDFGCNQGDILYRIPGKYGKFGIEINKNSADIARGKANATIYSTYNDLPDKLKFDIIYSIDVIEHLRSPRSFVLNTLSHVKSGGYIVLMTGNVNSLFCRLSGTKWWYSQYPEHISFISKFWSKKLSESIADLEVIKIKNYYRTKKRLLKRIVWFFIWVVNFILRNKSQNISNLSTKLTMLRMADMKHFGRNFSADHILVVFRKKESDSG
jgi:2-polyprenyl-3-methyl-5-hydroxy-6-metoxy-1,4-benzoquinol methylase